jgi:hypothetical protein
MESYNPNNPAYEPRYMSGREINEAITATIGRQLTDGTFKGF